MTTDTVQQTRRDKQAYSRLRQVSHALSFRPADPFLEACRHSFSGSISRSKFSEALSELVETVTAAECKTMFTLADVDGDGFVTHQEVVRVLKQAQLDKIDRANSALMPPDGLLILSKLDPMDRNHSPQATKDTVRTSYIGHSDSAFKNQERWPRRKSPERKKAERKAETITRIAAVDIRILRERIAEDIATGALPAEKVDLNDMKSIVQKAGIVVSNELINRAMQEFKALVPNKTGLDLNQFDIVMKRIGFRCPFDRHRLFRAFDLDFDNTVGYCEFILGIAMLLDGPLALKFDELWQKLDVKCIGELHEAQLFKMLAHGGSPDPIVKAVDPPHDEQLIRQLTERIFQRLARDMNGSLDYEEFQLGLQEDKVVASVFDKCLSGNLTDNDIAEAIEAMPCN